VALKFFCLVATHYSGNMNTPKNETQIEYSLLDCSVQELSPPKPAMENLPSEIIENIGYHLWANESFNTCWMR
jgi:hypothetical protein